MFSPMAKAARNHVNGATKCNNGYSLYGAAIFDVWCL